MWQFVRAVGNKEILGRCSSTHTYGCFHCDLKIQNWASTKKLVGNAHSIQMMKQRGEKAVVELGKSPAKGTSTYKKFTMSNCSQWG